MKPGEYRLYGADIQANVNREYREVKVVNRGDRPIQIGSHFHFYEVNESLDFDRSQAYGFRLNIPAGTAVRFEPNDEKVVPLVDLSGNRKVFGLNEKTNGQLD